MKPGVTLIVENPPSNTSVFFSIDVDAIRDSALR